MGTNFDEILKDERLAREALGLNVAVPWPHRKLTHKVRTAYILGGINNCAENELDAFALFSNPMK
jgi:hypothetical protein